MTHRARGLRSAPWLFPIAALVLASAGHAAVQDEPATPVTIVPRAWRTLDAVDRRGRRPFRPDAVFARHLLDRDAPPPEAGESLVGETGEERAWKDVEANEDGRVPGRPGWAYSAVESDAERVVLANLQGAATLFVNGAGFQGDMYRYGFRGVPVLLREGVNHVYVTGIRGGLSLRFVEPEMPLVIGTWDVTKPDLAIRPPGVGPMDAIAPLVLNASTEPIEARFAIGPDDEPTRADSDGFQRIARPVSHARLAPLGLAKPTINDLSVSFEAEPPARDLPRTLTVTAPGLEAPIYAIIVVHLREPKAAGRRVFRSSIDDSLQEYSVLPATEPSKVRGTVLSLHGAGVDALNQARSYSAKSNLVVIAPTNRRPFGFDWQDWGRADAYEVLADLPRRYKPSFTFLTGHSMGGHGVWHLAANDPDRFDAIAPSAGWRSFDTYGGRPDGELRELWHAADGTSDTEALLANLLPLPTFILHGEADDNVPASEAHAMEALLKEAGWPPETHYEEGAGHWWDGDAAPGADCLDWPGIFELFARTEATDVPLEFDWIGVDPAIDARHHWITVEQPLVYGKPFEVRTRFHKKRGEEAGTVTIETENVRRLILQHPASTVTSITLDGQVLWEFYSLALERDEDGHWAEAELATPHAEKSPRSCGPFKRAFDNRFVLVHGTAGDDERDAELLELARYHQEEWWYRANAVVPLVTDEGFDRHRKFQPRELDSDRNAILYGNADTNAAWDRLVPGSCPIRVREGAIELGERTFEGDDLACVFVYPRADGGAVNDPDERSLVGAFGSTGAAGARLAYVLAPFVSGVGYPDYVIFSSKILAEGDGGVLAAGWFDRRWELQPGGFVRD